MDIISIVLGILVVAFIVIVLAVMKSIKKKLHYAYLDATTALTQLDNHQEQLDGLYEKQKAIITDLWYLNHPPLYNIGDLLVYSHYPESLKPTSVLEILKIERTHAHLIPGRSYLMLSVDSCGKKTTSLYDEQDIQMNYHRYKPIVNLKNKKNESTC